MSEEVEYTDVPEKLWPLSTIQEVSSVMSSTKAHTLAQVIKNTKPKLSLTMYLMRTSL